MSHDAFPRRFGKYSLLEHLAQGGMGALYLAYQGEPGMEKLCVVKTVLRELADKEYVARFRDEAKVVVRLSHGNLVPVFDAGTVEGELYIAMDHVDGKDLRAVWNQCAKKGIAFPVDVAVFLVKELARGLHHAHTFGELRLVHRDVSPPNVLLAYSGEVKLTDFGLASSVLKMERTAPGIIYGKVSYMSPEQARGEPLDGRADLYAAGVILWELLTGRQLFPNSDGDALDRVRNPVIMRPSQRASRVPPGLDTIVMKALTPSRDDRYADGEELRAALAGYLAKEAPTIDTGRVAAFLRELFDTEIDSERRRREELIDRARRALASPEMARTPAVAQRAAVPPSGARHHGPDGEELEDEDRSAGVLGQLIDGRYKVNRLMGEGGMGRVYEAEHVEIGKRVAIKVLHPAYCRLPEVVSRFRREARAASRIGHPNIIDVTDSGTTQGGAVFFVMEYLEGCDLADVIAREQALAVDRAVTITIQLARALEAAHQANVIHRDLKPENIFLVARPGQPDFVKVLDFGIARNVEMEGSNPKLTKPNVAMGTPEYMAPEQAAGKPADGRADIYAAGAILFEMLTGTSPHRGENSMEVLNKKATETPPPVASLRADVTEELSKVIVKALSRSPADRQQTMTELADELERSRPDRRRLQMITRDAPAVPKAPVAPPPRPRTLFPGIPVAPAVAGLSLLLVGAGGLMLWRSAHPSVAQAVTRSDVLGDLSRPDKVVVKPQKSAPAKVDKVVDKPAEVAPPKVAAIEVQKEKEKPAKAEKTSHGGGASKGHPGSSAEAKKSLAEANRLLASHQYSQAERAFQKLLDAGHEKGPAATGLARCAFEASHYGDAARLGEKAVKFGGGLSAHMVFGDALFKEKKFDAAAREYRAVLKINPDHAEARQRLANALAKSG